MGLSQRQAERATLPPASPGLRGRHGAGCGCQGGNTPDASRTARPRSVLSRSGASGLSSTTPGAASVLSEPREFRVYDWREDGSDGEDRASDAVMAIVDDQQVFGKVFADQTPAALRAAELRHLRNIANAFAPVLCCKDPVALERLGAQADVGKLRRLLPVENFASDQSRQRGRPGRDLACDDHSADAAIS